MWMLVCETVEIDRPTAHLLDHGLDRRRVGALVGIAPAPGALHRLEQRQRLVMLAGLAQGVHHLLELCLCEVWVVGSMCEFGGCEVGVALCGV